MQWYGYHYDAPGHNDKYVRYGFMQMREALLKTTCIIGLWLGNTRGQILIGGEYSSRRTTVFMYVQILINYIIPLWLQDRAKVKVPFPHSYI